ncbi:aspartyl-tRNA synthetase 2, mitochondrial [Orbilia blumenaviensis]|uniref:Aspartyl-tRNA synthetase 2, mitochondrial n=1 Tax=Orbilia blumenaviensis TaxID=1796055 RepID=A0AAV9UWX4_9PEZI
MATPLRTYIRCQTDILQVAGKRRPSQSILNIRRQCSKLPSRLVPRRAYSDNPFNNSKPTSGPRITLDHITEQLGVPKPRVITQTQPRYAGEITGVLEPEPHPELTDEEFRDLHPGLGSLKPWTFPLDDSFQTIDSLSDYHINKSVRIRGWLYSTRPANAELVFASVLQGGKYIQATFDQNNGFEKPQTVLSLRSHTPIELEGILKYKPKQRAPAGSSRSSAIVPEGVEHFHKTLEIVVTRIGILGDPPKEPIIAGTTHGAEKRYISMRTNASLLKALQLRNQVSQICRKHLDEEGFLEIETPLLFKSTPEGAREFLVPTRNPGQMYALPQSPQQYKQILMAGGILKYFQLAKCFRDEDLRADRQPEFTQLDLEMGFADGVTVQKTIERLLKRIWYEALGEKLPAFRVMTYHMAIHTYGSDKPDTRYNMLIRPFEKIIDQNVENARIPVHSQWKYEIMTHPCNISTSRLSAIAGHIASPMDGDFAPLRGPNPECVIFKTGPELDYSVIRKQLGRIAPYLRDDALGLERAIGGLIAKNFIPTDSIIVIGRRKKESNPGGSTNIGQLRKLLSQHLIKSGFMEKLVGWKFLWVTHFPLFTPVDPSDNEPGQSGTAGYKSTHHPFTAPTVSTRDSLLESPWKTLGHHYDIVLNGVELGGGSTRIHDAELQRSILEDVLKVPKEKMKTFQHLLDMLQTGCPPHAGLAIGFDRLIATLAGTDSIRDVIAFPKNNRGQDPVVSSPGLVTEKQLDEYGIMLKDTGLLEDQEEPDLVTTIGAEKALAASATQETAVPDEPVMPSNKIEAEDQAEPAEAQETTQVQEPLSIESAHTSESAIEAQAEVVVESVEESTELPNMEPEPLEKETEALKVESEESKTEDILEVQDEKPEEVTTEKIEDSESDSDSDSDSESESVKVNDEAKKFE